MAARLRRVRTAYLATTDVVSRLLHRAELARQWTEPSALVEFRISGLAGHLARAAFTVETALAVDEPAGTPVDAVTYYLAGDDIDGGPQHPISQRIRERGEESAGAGAAELASRFDAAGLRLARALPREPADRLVLAFGKQIMRLDDYLLTRIIEMAVHVDDLAVSLGVPTPPLPQQAAEAALTTLTLIAARRRGPLPVLRALSRRERFGGNASAF